ncbi:glycosyltransferase [Geobacter sp. AOG2]|uniref:glycosyltransferase n=1 Tax=Geobacter sp. AOG2 TaxID=1566347 RepID=UPI001CC5FBFD|nr:glycosyltransferase [Geobacter sp. AOG2]GFE60833.1 glycosyl transferase [Geobacter sp. AOG2]
MPYANDIALTTRNHKILHVVLSMEVGGAEKLVYDMVNHPMFAENKPLVCCLDALGELGEMLRRNGYTVYIKNRREGLDLSVIPWLREIIRREGVTIVHAHQYTPLFYSVPAVLLAGRAKLVYTEHGRFYPDRKSWKRTLLNPLLAYGVDHLVSISASTARAMSTYDNLPLSRIKIINNGIHLTRMNPQVDVVAKRKELGLSETCRIIGTASRLNEIKNIPMMLEVFKRVLQDAPDTVLLIAGQGPQEESLRLHADQLGIADRVKFIGLRFDLPEIYRLLDVFLLTSFTEGISITLLEAMASGVPAVATDVGGNCEVMVDGLTGYLVPIDADVEMAEKIVRLLRDPALARQFGMKGQERVFTEFTFDRMMGSYIQQCYLS